MSLNNLRRYLVIGSQDFAKKSDTTAIKELVFLDMHDQAIINECMNRLNIGSDKFLVMWLITFYNITPQTFAWKWDLSNLMAV